jgi:hypothetical protein
MQVHINSEILTNSYRISLLRYHFSFFFNCLYTTHVIGRNFIGDYLDRSQSQIRSEIFITQPTVIHNKPILTALSSTKMVQLCFIYINCLTCYNRFFEHFATILMKNLGSDKKLEKISAT